MVNDCGNNSTHIIETYHLETSNTEFNGNLGHLTTVEIIFEKIDLQILTTLRRYSSIPIQTKFGVLGVSIRGANKTRRFLIPTIKSQYFL